MNGILEIVNKLGPQRLVAMGAVTLALIGFFAFVMTKMSTPGMGVLFSDLPMQDSNTIIRDPAWRKKDAGGALRINPDDAAALRVVSGEPVRLTTKRDSVLVVVEVSDTMQRGHVALPNGLGLGYPTTGGDVTTGIAPNELTSIEDRDPFVGTPWHKHVAARVDRP